MKILHGEPPPEVLAWREEVLGHFCRRVDAGQGVNKAEIKKGYMCGAVVSRVMGAMVPPSITMFQGVYKTMTCAGHIA